MELDWGGHWTVKKMAIIKDYLKGYLTALCNQPFYKVYIDGFAGEGYRIFTEKSILFGEQEIIIKGSPLIALEQSAIAKKPFDRFIFIESNDRKAELLERLRDRFPQFADCIEILRGDANDVMARICSSTNWKRTRALAFLDPYGLQVQWSTMKCIAETRGIDIWLLFPLSAVIRMLKRAGEIDGKMRERLNQLFGTDSWETTFYSIRESRGFFQSDPQIIRTAGFKEIIDFVVNRLTTIFPGQVISPLPLYNTKIPLFLLCFTCGNPAGSFIANRIAQSIIKKYALKDCSLSDLEP